MEMSDNDDIASGIIAVAFARYLRGWLTEAEMAEVNRLNATPAYDAACASHDYCDPNEAMLKAFAFVMGRDMDPGADEDAGLANRAWEVAREAQFAPQKVEQYLPLGDMDEWADFWAENGAALTGEVGDEVICLALARNCNLLIGGGAAPLVRVGFKD